MLLFAFVKQSFVFLQVALHLQAGRAETEEQLAEVKQQLGAAQEQLADAKREAAAAREEAGKAHEAQAAAATAQKETHADAQVGAREVLPSNFCWLHDRGTSRVTGGQGGSLS